MDSLEREAKLKSEEVRRNLGYGDEPIQDIYNVIQNLDILLVRAPIDRESLSAFFLRRKKNFIIFINTSKSLGHQYFSAAHELYHYFYDEGMAGQICKTARFNEHSLENEKLADYFAVHLLMPESSVIRHIKKLGSNGELDIRKIIKLQQFFKVSYKAILIRLKELEFINSTEFENLKNVKIIKETAKLGYNTSLAKPTNDQYISPDYIQLARSNYENNKITYNKYIQYLEDAGINPKDLISDEEEVDVFAE